MTVHLADHHDFALRDTVAGVLDHWAPGMPAVTRATLLTEIADAVRNSGWRPPVSDDYPRDRTLLALRSDGRPSPSTALCSDCVQYAARRWPVGLRTSPEEWLPVADEERAEVPGCTYCGWPN